VQQVIEIRGKILESDYVDAQRLHSRARRVIAIMGVVVLLLGLAVTILNVMAWLNGSISAGDAALFPFLVGLLLAYLFVLRPWSWRRTYRKHPALHEPVSIDLGDDGLAYASDHGEGELPWRMFIKWREGKRLFLLYSAPNLFHIIPKRTLEADRVESLRSLLSEKLGRAV